MGSWPARRHGGDGGHDDPVGLRQAVPGGDGSGEGKGLRQARGAAPMRLPTIYRGGGGWFLALQIHRGVGQGGRKEIPPFLSPPIAIPPF
jgi:hypothetical protein